jgi:catechol 2,3-dioxygenase-like lactoylglutathione lyase family enzyme
MIDHITLRVRDFDKSKAFYLAALAPLGYEVVMEFDSPEHGKFCGLGVNKKPDFWIAPHKEKHPAPAGQHIAFRSRERKQVDAFHKAALAAGAKDDGAPGARQNYHPNYYGAFVVDINGNHLEACKHEPE